MVHFLEPVDTNQAHIAPPNFFLALTCSICHLFCMMKMRNLWMTTRCYPSNSFIYLFIYYYYYYYYYFVL